MFPVFPSYPYISFPFLSTEYKSLQQCSPSCAMSCSQGDRVRGPYGECQQCWRLLWGVIMELSYLTPAPCSHSDSSRKCDKKSDREKRKKRWGLPKGRWDYLLLVVNNHVFILFMFQIYVRWVCKKWHWMHPFCNGSDKAPLVKYDLIWFDILRHKACCAHQHKVCLTVRETLSHKYFFANSKYAWVWKTRHGNHRNCFFVLRLQLRIS